jgi:hypothetical protein
MVPYGYGYPLGWPYVPGNHQSTGIRPTTEQLPLDRWKNVKWEYAILRSGALRPLTFRVWNSGIRAQTTPYLRW